MYQESTIIVAPTSTLCDEHWADLEASGLTRETVERLGMFATVSRDEAVEHTRYKWLPPGDYLRIECPSFDGSRSPSRVRYKLPSARPAWLRDTKYVSLRGVSSFAFWTPAVKSDVVIIVEGEKKAVACYQCGYRAVGLLGVSNGFIGRKGDRTAERVLIDDLRCHLSPRDRILLLFDTDSRWNPAVRHAAVELQRVMVNKHGLDVTVSWLPPGAIAA